MSKRWLYRNKKRWSLILSFAIGMAGVVLQISDTFVHIPGIPGWLSESWGTVYGLSLIINRVGSFMLTFHPEENK